MQIAVHAIAHAHAVGKRLDVHVGGTAVYGVAQNRRDEFYRRRVFLNVRHSGRARLLHDRRIKVQRRFFRLNWFIFSFFCSEAKSVTARSTSPPSWRYIAKNSFKVFFRNAENFKRHSGRARNEVQRVNALNGIRIRHPDFEDALFYCQEARCDSAPRFLRECSATPHTGIFPSPYLTHRYLYGKSWSDFAALL
jgi:hypothetical protein